ncbi:LytTR family DNA-binding domain-containing protein [Aureivirga marina]|uniref:LytTR family DNA-binding domain-containing protein n=1 Tax=Aureivirga marina TaxID=1182451 RepID=UPI0018CB0965|nr:LytTR family DNA-binding domain-containing protein [Aureivirga marina]
MIQNLLVQNLESSTFYFDKKKYVLSGTFFLVFFLIFYTPFNLSNTFYSSKEIEIISVFFTFTEGFCAFLSLYISQFIFRKYFFHSKMHLKTHFQLFFIENMLIVALLPFFGYAFSKIYGLPIHISQNLIQNEFLNTLFIYSVHLMILIFPFVGTLFFSKMRSLNSEKNSLENKIQLLKVENPTIELQQEIAIENDKGKVELKLTLDSLLYLESNNQYVMIYYVKKGKLVKRIVRNRLKNMLKELEKFKIIQCHRSYGVNIHHVNYIKTMKGNRYLFLQENSAYKVPVSKTYFTKIQEILQN